MEPSETRDFWKYFNVLSAQSPDALEKIFRIRYQVYCKEFGFEKEEDCPGGLEQDTYDLSAKHCLIIHRATKMGAGCIRLVIPPESDPTVQLPMERFCGNSLTDPVWHPGRLPRATVAEVSRLAVHTGFRRRSGEWESPAGRITSTDSGKEERRTFPLLSLALFYAGASMMVLAGREHAFVMIEPSLARRMQARGLPFMQVGEPLQYHGRRAAHYVSVNKVIEGIPNDMRAFYDGIHEHLRRTKYP